MIIGNPELFALESDITVAYERLGLLGIGYFTIHLGGFRYGLYDPLATALAVSFDEVNRRINRRGQHTAPFSTIPSAVTLATAAIQAIYGEDDRPALQLGFQQSHLSEVIYRSDLLWAPDGDEAFDDGSRILHFDIGDQVRLIGCRQGSAYAVESGTLRDIIIPGVEFYQCLEQWSREFESLWRGMAKTDPNEPL